MNTTPGNRQEWRRIVGRLAVVAAVLLFSVTVVDVVPAVASVLAELGWIEPTTAEPTDESTKAQKAQLEAGAERLAPQANLDSPLDADQFAHIDPAAMTRLLEYVADQSESTLSQSISNDRSTDEDAFETAMGRVDSGSALTTTLSQFTSPVTASSPASISSSSAPYTTAALSPEAPGESGSADPTASTEASGSTEGLAGSTNVFGPASTEGLTFADIVAQAERGLLEGGSSVLLALPNPGVDSESSPELNLVALRVGDPLEFGEAPLLSLADASDLEVAPLSAPEPVTLVLLGIGLLGFAAYRRRARA